MAARRTRPASRKRPKRARKKEPARSTKRAKAQVRPKRPKRGKGKTSAPPDPSPREARPPRRVAAARAVAVGRVVHYFATAGAAELVLEGPIRCGDTLHLRGHTTDLLQPVESLRRGGARIQRAGAAESVTLAVAERVRSGDRVYRLEFPGDADDGEPSA
jgi:hypothetical protein